jgi:hypothetical protein
LYVEQAAAPSCKIPDQARDDDQKRHASFFGFLNSYKMLKKWIGTAATGCMLCMAGLIMTGTAFSAGGQESLCVDNKDGTVTDNNSGLMWQKASAGVMRWNDASIYASGLSLAGHSGWRLPTKDELVGLYNSPCKKRMEVVSDWYWSSSPCAGIPGYVWKVSFTSGDVDRGYMGDHYKSSRHLVRPVRNAR